MKRAHRLSSARDFRSVLTSGTRARSAAASCAVLATDRLGPARVGIRAPRALGGAVIRNRANRRLRAAVPLTSLTPGADVVLTARRGALSMDFPELAASLREALRRAGAL